MELKSDKVLLLKEILVTQMNHWILYPAYIALGFMFANTLNAETPSSLIWVVMGIYPIAFYFVRTRVKSAWKTSVIYLLMIAASYFFPVDHEALRYYNIAVSIMYVIYSIILRYKSEGRYDTKFYLPVVILLDIAMLYLEHYLDFYGHDYLFLFIVIICIGVYFIIYYIEQYLRFLNFNKSSAANIPANQMFHSGIMLVGIYSLASVFILLALSKLVWLKYILKAIKNFISLVSGFILQLFPSSSDHFTEKEMGNVAQMAENYSFDEVVALNPIWNVIENVLVYSLLIFFVLLVIFILYKILSYLSHRFSSKAEDQDLKTDSFVEVHEKCVVTSAKAFKIRDIFKAKTNEEKIRKTYREYILKSKSSIIGDKEVSLLNVKTSLECAECVNNLAMNDIYEKARYSDTHCSDEDVRNMKNLCK